MVRRSSLLLFICLTSCSLGGVLAIGPQAGTVLAQSTLIAQTTADSDLYVGLRSAAVETLQTELQAQGFYEGTADGVFGLSTQKAVLAFQANAGIEPTGRWDEASRQALETAQAAADEPDGESTSGESASGESASGESVSDEASDDQTDVIASDTADEAAGRNSRLTKLLWLGLGLSAIAGSVGAGFFIVSRKKDAPSTENWLDITDDAHSPSEGATPTSPASVTDSDHIGYPPDQDPHTWPSDYNEPLDGLLRTLRTSDSKSRREAIWTLGQRGHSQAVQPLVNLMTEVDSKEKSLILAALSEIGTRSLRPLSHALSNALQDDNPEVRKNAIRDLSRVYDLVVQTTHLLGHAAEDEDHSVRQTARWALDQLNRIRQPQIVKPTADSMITPNIGPSNIEPPNIEPPNIEPSDRTVLNNASSNNASLSNGVMPPA